MKSDTGNMCLVSVMITTHNRAELVVNAINSVLNQTFKNYELLIVDDASKDNTEEVVKTFLDRRIKYIKISPEETKGGNHARNVGIKEAKGEFIAFLDDDDEWMPEKLEKQLEVFNKHKNAGFVYSGALWINTERETEHEEFPLKRGNLSREVLISNFVCSFSSVVVRKSKIEAAGLFDIKMPACQDYDMFIRVCQICEVDFVGEILVKYYSRSNFARIGCNVKKYESAYSLIEEKYNGLISSLDKESEKKRKLAIYWMLSSYALDGGDFIRMKRYYRKFLSIKFDLKIFIKLCFAFVGIYDFRKIKRNFFLTR